MLELFAHHVYIAFGIIELHLYESDDELVCLHFFVVSFFSFICADRYILGMYLEPVDECVLVIESYV